MLCFFGCFEWTQLTNQALVQMTAPVTNYQHHNLSRWLYTIPRKQQSFWRELSGSGLVFLLFGYWFWMGFVRLSESNCLYPGHWLNYGILYYCAGIMAYREKTQPFSVKCNTQHVYVTQTWVNVKVPYQSLAFNHHAHTYTYTYTHTHTHTPTHTHLYTQSPHFRTILCSWNN